MRKRSRSVLTGEFYTQKSREEMIKKEPVGLVQVYKMPESAIIDWLKLPEVAIASDGMPIIADDITWDTPFRRSSPTPIHEVPEPVPRRCDWAEKTAFR